MRLFLVLSYFFVLIFSSNVVAEPLVLLDSVKVDVLNEDALLKGAKFFKQNCLSCHSLNLWRYDSLAKKADITYEMMPKWSSLDWAGHPPPDLSLIALEKSPRWIYTYLHTFFEDKSRPTGFNNLVYPNTNMPNPFVGSQGILKLLDEDMKLNELEQGSKKHWYEIIALSKRGSSFAHEFDRDVQDLVTFLAYVADPSVVERRKMSLWVLGYLAVMIASSYLVFREYKKRKM